MAYDTRFGPGAQNPEQRAQLHNALPSLKATASAKARQLCARYVATELSWLCTKPSMPLLPNPA